MYSMSYIILFNCLLYANIHQQHLTAEYNKQADMKVEQAMIGFLKIIYKWPTFGCAFFEVKVRIFDFASNTFLF